MNSAVRTMIFAILAFTIPMGTILVTRWNDIRPYLIADPALAEGHLLYFTAKG
ncbi:MAG: hypothetical protein KDA60_04705 [Planctomycetales bacterium]|nr:hypothetical protein [Planctomycetales bacterium]